MKRLIILLLLAVSVSSFGQSVRMRINGANTRKVFINAPGRPSSVYLNGGPEAIPDNDIDAPVVYRLSTNTAGDKIYIDCNKAMNNPTGEHSSFSVSGKTVTAAGLKSGESNIIELTLNSAVTAGDEVLLSFQKGTVQATDEGFLQSFNSAPVLNARYAGSIPFFDNWDFVIDATDFSTLDTSSGNITRIFDKANTGRFFRVQSTAYATYSTNLIQTVYNTSNEYTSNEEVRKPADGTYTFWIKFKTPAYAGDGATQSMYFIRHSSTGSLILSTWNSGRDRRNFRAFTTADYFSSSITQSTIENNEDYHYVVATYDGTTYKLWDNGNYTSRTTTQSTVEIFNRLLHLNSTGRAPYGLVGMGIGPYLSDANVSTLNTFLSTYGE